MLIEILLGKRDLLIPYFMFNKVLRGNMESTVLQEIYKLRYEVYCLECKYLTADDFQEEMETDNYDESSTHFAAYNLDQSIVGTVRLVQPHDEQEYPFESHCGVFDGFEFPDRKMCGEISRLVVRKTYRRRRGDSMEGVSKDFVEEGSVASIKPNPESHQRSTNSPLLLLGMYREMYRHSRQNNIRYWYAAMERSLARSLEKMGFKFIPIGPQTDYYGQVTPHIVDLEELNVRLRRENRFLAAWFNDEPIPIWIMVKTLVGSMKSQAKKK
ncbi:PEP-CTERM/exosortase system-associated acyltransferase [Solimicrobium silvestre]|uniref:N-acyl amino acid synthase, PEP-CTERM/exosortase system-associated n=1 Tax=Solimicrobium silvestre TaxID=2099400 RepID=A0A2S9GTA3_9BURK|nr:PEP-CTERM/exosortase system-associated acyltransferase [Solimicrobium silvestre]PRC90947.1 N-acyl amino acid synthase, PEP-CTERM/exosortase system-associated [Solimicrobium silvestre]